jgi:hypothetical protein
MNVKLLLPLLILPSLIFASKILSYNVYDRTDRVDIMLAFDTPYEGTLRQSRQSNRIIVKLDGASIESPKVKNVASPYLGKLTITPIGDQTQIIAAVPSSVEMQASKTSDAFGLRLRFSKAAAAAASTSNPETAAATAPLGTTLPTKPEAEYQSSYMVVIAVLVIGILIMLWLKSRIGAAPVQTGKKPWIFNKGGSAKDDVRVRFQKPLDQKNRVVMLDYADESYLVVIGTTNMLLEKFHDRQPVTQNDFEEMLQHKHEELDRFLQIDHDRDTLQSYKEKASGIDH